MAEARSGRRRPTYNVHLDVRCTHKCTLYSTHTCTQWIAERLEAGVTHYEHDINVSPRRPALEPYYLAVDETKDKMRLTRYIGHCGFATIHRKY